MSKQVKLLRERWLVPSPEPTIPDRLELLFSEGLPVADADFRGAPLSAESPFWYRIRLLDRTFERCDFSFSEIDVVLGGSVLKDCRFESTVMEQAHFAKAKVEGCSFDKAVFKRVLGSDIRAENSTFRSAVMKSFRYIPTNFVRGRFHRCDFANAKLEGVELRAAQFVDCNFTDARFKAADMRGTKFFGAAPTPDQLVDCITEGAKFNGDDLVVSA